MDVKKQSEIRMQPLEDPARFGVVLERADLEALKIAAIRMDTTASEIIRALVADFVKDRTHSD
jgi:hypothetical protein